MYNANVYNIMIGAPSDITDEISITKDVINKWNQLRSYSERKVLFPLHWSMSAHPSYGKEPQKSINEQVITKSDLLICIFCTRLGTPTSTHSSGTIEEIEEHHKNGKPVMIFFRTEGSIKNTNPEQLKQLQEFKDSTSKIALYTEYSNASEFTDIFREKLELCIAKNFTENIAKTNSSNTNFIASEFNDEEKAIIKSWAQSVNGIAYTIECAGRNTLYFFGDKNIQTNNPRDKAKMDDFIDRLYSLGFTQLKHDNKGNPYYTLKNSAYEYTETL